ncbi:MAG: hypothetical protein XD75_0196 [Parcubacteria bacterium 33_209]|nr:MAG: hypothetical protein XD75_0196 [Parcubacteria bacterium 33_209]
MAKQNNKNEIEKEKKIKKTKEKKSDQVKKYYEAESWMFSSCGD